MVMVNFVLQFMHFRHGGSKGRPKLNFIHTTKLHHLKIGQKLRALETFDCTDFDAIHTYTRTYTRASTPM